MKRNKKPHISAIIYESDFSLTYECVGELSCKFALCEVMPPNEESVCCFYDHGGCRSYEAQKSSLEFLRGKISGALKQLKEDEQS